MDNENLIKGGEFLIKETDANDVFIPEEFDEEQIMIAQTCEDFLESEVFDTRPDRCSGTRIDAQFNTKSRRTWVVGHFSTRTIRWF